MSEKGYEAGLVRDEDYGEFQVKKTAIESEMAKLENTKITPNEAINNLFKKLGLDDIKKSTTLKELLRRPGVFLATAYELMQWENLPELKIIEQLEIMIKYEGYINQQMEQVKRFKNMEGVKIPQTLSFDEVSGLSKEVREKLITIKPESIGQATRVSGVTPAAISMLLIHLKKMGYRL